jgi:hypothetical protein
MKITIIPLCGSSQVTVADLVFTVGTRLLSPIAIDWHNTGAEPIDERLA